MITYPGLPGPVVSDFMGREASRGHYAEGTTFHIARLRMVANTGTYLDAPFHRFAHGKDVGSLPLERLADLEGVVVDASGRGPGARRGALRGGAISRARRSSSGRVGTRTGARRGTPRGTRT